MGGRGRHAVKALTTVQVRAFKLPGRYADGNGLYRVVEPQVRNAGSFGLSFKDVAATLA